MSSRGMGYYLCLFLALLGLISARQAAALELRGQITFQSLPVPGATVIATHGDKKITAITDREGRYSLPDLTAGSWNIEVEMTGFAPAWRQVVLPGTESAMKWELTLLPLNQIQGEIKSIPIARPSGTQSAKAQPKTEVISAPHAESSESAGENQSASAANGFLINGSQNNASASQFAQAPAFGNHRSGTAGLYNGGIGMIFDNSAFDATPYSLTGLATPKPSYSNLTGTVTLGGPLKIPHILPNGPNFFVGFEWTRDSDATTQSAAVPSQAQRGGDFSGQSGAVYDPRTGLPFPQNRIPPDRISYQAQALLKLYPLPNFNGGPRYNYQIPILSDVHRDALQSRFNQALPKANSLWGGFAYQSTRTGAPNLFGFLDTTDVLGINTDVHWWHRISQQFFMTSGFQYSRLRTRVTPYFENRQNVSGDAQILGNNQDPPNWGPPSLNFSSGLAGLSDAQSAYNRNQTGAVSYSMLWVHNHHNITFGGDFRRQEFNYLSQQDPRGTFTFTGAATQGDVDGTLAGGSDFADFLLGIPDTSSIAYGNPDKYFRESVYDAYVSDDWRVTPKFTVNAGMRWEYGAPITELFNRLVNLDISRGFTKVAPVVASDPVGLVTGQTYPSSLVRPDKSGFEPRLGIAWHPISGSSLVIRGGYGIYDDTSVYQTIATQMAQQPPLSKTLSVENTPTCPLTMADGFNPCSSITENTYAIDPNFRIGYAQNWQLAMQRDLPGSLQITATYLGTKGTHGVQEFLPNTYPIGATNPCPMCPSGFAYLISNGDSTREAAEIQLRRRLHNGFAAALQYTYSKSIDDDSMLGGQGASAATQNATQQNSLGAVGASGSGTSQGSSQSSPTIAQNWLDLKAERGPSTFDQRHLLSAAAQYTTGMGLGGNTLLSGWKGKLVKEWTFLGKITAGSGFPQTPVYLAAVPRTGVTGSIRPDLTGAPVYAAPPGYFLNPAAYTAPQSGQWGNAGRDSITGPSEFSLDASLGRTFRLHDRLNLDLRIDATNLLNHVTYTAWNTTTTSPQFGLPLAANSMRSLQTTLRLRF